MRVFAFFVVLAGLMLTMAANAQTSGTEKPPFAVGQMWSIKSPTPTTAKIVIGRVENFSDMIAVHISVLDVPIPAGAPGAGRTIAIGHMPFEQTALAASVDQLLGTGASPDRNFEGGYANWQSAKGGIYTISVEKAVQLLFDALTQRNIPAR